MYLEREVSILQKARPNGHVYWGWAIGLWNKGKMGWLSSFIIHESLMVLAGQKWSKWITQGHVWCMKFTLLKFLILFHLVSFNCVLIQKILGIHVVESSKWTSKLIILTINRNVIIFEGPLIRAIFGQHY